METGMGRRTAYLDSRLETFLGGMETGGGIAMSERVTKGLKPSLVEWKPTRRNRRSVVQDGLKPSLVEWKPRAKPHAPRGHSCLKPSLVEWKQEEGFDNVGVNVLETFLGGMETTSPTLLTKVFCFP